MINLTYLGYSVRKDGVIWASCGCPQCDDYIQPGHYRCSTSPDGLIEDEKTEDGCYRTFTAERWVWNVPLSHLI